MTKVARLVGCAFVGMSTTALPAELEPTLDFGVIRTDNLTQASVDPEAATIWKLVPTFTFTQDSTRLDTDASYRVEAYHYQERGENDVINTFDGNARVAAVPDRFFFNIGGARTQAILDPSAGIPVSNFVVTTNRVDLDEYYVGPEFSVPVGGNVVFMGDLRRTRYRYADDLAAGEQDYSYDTGTITIDNYARGRGATWALQYDYERADYESLPPYERRQALMQLGFWANDVTRFFVSSGKETPWDEPFVTDLEDSFWETGFARTSDRLSAEVAFGERTFGRSRRAQVTYSFESGSTEFSYSETPTTTAGDRYMSGGLLDPDEPFDYLFQAGSVERYIENRAQWTFKVDRDKFGFSAVLFDEIREDRSLVDGTPLEDEEQSGANLSVTWKVRTKLDIVFGAQAANRFLVAFGESDLSTGALSAIYRLGGRTELTVRLERWEEESLDFAGPDYEANVFSATVVRTFR